MILIADSGSTKTDWKCTDGSGEVHYAQTNGMNPYYMDDLAIGMEVESCWKQFGKFEINTIYFYGAGCSTKEQKQKIADQLIRKFKSSEIHVETDLLGGARALCQHEPGVVCILGTGSGSCVYDGIKIANSIPSLGFILGDEGSGAYFGKLLIRDFLRGDMPESMIDAIRSEFSINKDIVLQHVNQGPMPSRYLGQFSRFILDHVHETYVYDLVCKSFNDFIDKYIIRYPEAYQSRIHFTGSIAVNFKTILSKCLVDRDLAIGNVERSPIDGLVEYHLT